MPAIRAENGTDTVGLIKDVFDEEKILYVEDELQALNDDYPALDRKIVKSYEDTFNFAETVRLLAIEGGEEAEVSLKGFFVSLAENPEAQKKFLQTYRAVRKQRVEILIDGLTGKKDIPLFEGSKEKDIKKWTDYARQQKGQPALDPDSIRTVQDFQMAYMEASSPDRLAA